MLAWLRQPHTRTWKQPDRRPCRSIRPCLEELEERSLMAVSVAAFQAAAATSPNRPPIDTPAVYDPSRVRMFIL